MPFVCKTLRFTTKICHTPVLSCSEDGQIAFASENGTFILSLQARVVEPNEHDEGLSFYLDKIPTSSTTHEFDLGYDRDKLQSMLPEDELFQLLLDRTLSPGMQTSQTFTAIQTSCWSPAGADPLKRCVLATLSMDHLLSIYSQGSSRQKWKKVINISQVIKDWVVNSNFKCLKGWLKETKTEFDVFKRKVYALSPVAMGWSPTQTNQPASQSEQLTSSKSHKCYTLLAVALKSGHIALIKVMLPVTESSASVMCMVNVKGGLPYTLTWCGTELVAVGFQNGDVHLWRIVEREEESNVKEHWDLELVSKLWDDADDIAVTTLAWSEHNKVLVAAKGIHVLGFALDQQQNAARQMCYRLGTKLPVNAISWCANGLYVGSEDQRIWHLTFPSGNESTTELVPNIEEITLTGERGQWKQHGLCSMPHGIYLVLLRSPAVYFCHLGMKASLQFQVIQMIDNSEVYKRIMAGTELWSPALEPLACLISGVEQSEGFPVEVAPIIDSQSQLEKLTIPKLKLLRFLLQSKLIRLKKKPEEEKTISVTICNIDQIFMTRHVASTLTEFIASDIKSETLNEKEKTSLCVMCQSLQHITGNHEQVAAQVMNRLGLTLSVLEQPLETCLICSKKIGLTNFDKDGCEDGHTFRRDMATLLLCQEPNYRVCTSCKVQSLAYSNADGPYFSQVMSHECTFCYGRLV